jgi:hypothetical protein
MTDEKHRLVGFMTRAGNFIPAQPQIWNLAFRIGAHGVFERNGEFWYVDGLFHRHGPFLTEDVAIMFAGRGGKHSVEELSQYNGAVVASQGRAHYVFHRGEQLAGPFYNEEDAIASASMIGMLLPNESVLGATGPTGPPGAVGQPGPVGAITYGGIGSIWPEGVQKKV